MVAPTNADAAALLDQYGRLLELTGESPFRIRAYRRAAEALRSADAPVARLVAEQRLQEIPGIGPGIAALLTDYVRSGRFGPLEALSAQIPVSVLQLLDVPGLGPKTATRLYRELGIADLDQLEAALTSGVLTALGGLGGKAEANIRAGLDSLRRRSGRTRLGIALPLGRRLVEGIRRLLPDATVSLAGSVRRMEETVGDIDVVVGHPSPDAATTALQSLDLLDNAVEIAPHHIEARLSAGPTVHVAVVPRERFGTALVQATGSAGHLELLGANLRVAETEDAVYHALGLPVIPPELRRGREEMTWARTGVLERLINQEAIRGEFHCHTTWSDGAASVAQMAAAAAGRGYAYLGISDHSGGLGVANGLDSERLRAQRQEIDAYNGRADRVVELLAGAEVEVRRDGSLDYADDVLDGLDLVIASLHVGLRQPTEELTERLTGVLRHPSIDIVAHPSGRLIEQREGGAFDWERVFAVAAASQTALEINADPARLDLNAERAAQALAAGCRLTINCDAHHPDGFANLEYGLAVARQAGATPAQVVNCWPLDEVRVWLRERSRHAR